MWGTLYPLCPSFGLHCQLREKWKVTLTFKLHILIKIIWDKNHIRFLSPLQFRARGKCLIMLTGKRSTEIISYSVSLGAGAARIRLEERNWFRDDSVKPRVGGCCLLCSPGRGWGLKHPYIWQTFQRKEGTRLGHKLIADEKAELKRSLTVWTWEGKRTRH